MNTTETNHAKENAAAHCQEIVDKLAEIESGRREHHDDDCPEGCESEACYVDLTDNEIEELREELREQALSVQVRGPWYDPGTEAPAPDEFEILLTTGGPALRIRGDLAEYGTPRRAYMEYQDWGTPWTQYFDVEGATLLEFASLFWFGE